MVADCILSMLSVYIHGGRNSGHWKYFLWMDDTGGDGNTRTAEQAAKL